MSRSPKKPHSPTKPSRATSSLPSSSGLLTPPHSQTGQVPPQTAMLMSPPPEETLRTPRKVSSSNAAVSEPGVAFRVGFTGRVISNTLSGKRKRGGPSNASSTSSIAEEVAMDDNQAGPSSRPTVDATPNPKPRKQTKRNVSFAPSSPSRETSPQPPTPTKSSRTHLSPTKKALLLSPHAQNPRADYIPPSLSQTRENTSTRRRSTTPIPPYEPPSERFTPPREIICSPTSVVHTPKGHKRKAPAKSTGKAKKLVLQIKKEFPDDIDLSAPIPPPSPTDDPLLLRGPPWSRKRNRRASSHPLQAPVFSRDTPPMASTSPIRAPDMDRTRLLDLNMDSVMDLTGDDTVQEAPAFDFSAGDDGGDDWSDDEQPAEQAFDQAGEFTGKFKEVPVPTKQDPPSSVTRARAEAWGRPISPFPRAVSLEAVPESPIVDTHDAQEHGLSPVVARRSQSPSHPIAGPSNANDLFSPPRRPLRSPIPESRPALRLSPQPEPERAESPLPPSDEEPSSPDEPHRPQGPFDFGVIDDSRLLDDDDDDDMYEDQVVPIHDTSVDSIVLDDVAPPVMHDEDQLPAPTLGEDGGSADVSTAMIEELEDTYLTFPTSPPIARRRSLSPSSPPSGPEASEPVLPEPPAPAEFIEPEVPMEEQSFVAEKPSAAEESFVDESSAVEDEADSGSYRSPQMLAGGDFSDDEEEDEVSVVRELSQPPDFDDEDVSAQPVTDSFARFSLFGSPNPFDLNAQARLDAIAQHSPVPRPRGSLVAERSRIYEQSPLGSAVPEYVVVEEEDDDLEDLDERVIKITSEDPRAAARAAAILRLHKYDCLEQPSPRSRRPSTGLDSVLRKARRRSTLEGGITKSSSTFKRRQTLGGMVGDKVFIPGSPAMTLPQLLHEAEQSLHIDDRSTSGSPFRSVSPSSYKTPARAPSLYQSVLRSTVSFPTSSTPAVGPRIWCKDDWKKLDSCYTDERLAVAEASGMVAGEMASADEVDPEAVVDRFIELLGGEGAVAALGPTWTRDDLLKRARALQRKQRSGHVAPPTPSRSGSVLSTDTASTSAPYQRFMSSVSPEPSSHSSDATATEQPFPETPLSHNVKYAELMEEALSITETPHSGPISSYTSATESRRNAAPRPSSIATRVKGFLFSYLPYMKSTPAPPKSSSLQAGLPIPPADLFLRPRPPITTPAPKPAPKPAHPKELVQLQPAPAPEKPSMIPRPTEKNPRRLVDLNHVSPPPENRSMRSSLSSRRGSNASVKDLAKLFETLEQETDRVPSEVNKQKSIQDWSVGAASSARGLKSTQKSVWRP
ncbi:hypothetical protein EIP91_011430 [Steccherinum ochraceum]|uniref:Uncharacterized protein n=1 Tax=Steccherinum ochraceum TaxID=92696 RepID=A0A4R0RLV3_9APHY|nr:hypothetical protein EIP91_011430 [Steccherinum ochraceum]